MLDIKKTALCAGVFAAVWFGIIGILLGVFGDGFLTLVQDAHLVNASLTVSFSVLGWVLGVVYHFIIGLVVGALFALIWNKVNKFF